MIIREEFDKLFENSDKDIVFDFELSNFFKDVMLIHKGELPPLYRYSAADYNNIRGLETQTLFLTPIGKTNDVFEGLSCEIDDYVIDKIDELSDIAFVKSFSENKNNLLMWAHYADKYSGMCVEYDFNKLSNAILCHLYPIHYSNKRLKNRWLDQAINEHKDLKKMNQDNNCPNDCDFIKDIMSLFLVKSKAWEYESEWRFIATYPHLHNEAENVGDELENFYDIGHSDICDKQVLSIKSCITGVYLGPKMKENIKKHITEICNEKLNGIPVYSSRLSKNKYKLEFNKVNKG